MSAVYSFCKQIHPPTAVENCLYCSFYNSSEQNLVVAGATVLKIYRLVPEAEVLIFCGYLNKFIQW